MNPMNSKKLDQVLDTLAKIGQKHIKKSESLFSSINIKDDMIKIASKQVVLDPIEKKLRTGYIHAISKEQPATIKMAAQFTERPPTAEEFQKDKPRVLNRRPGSAMSKYPSGSESNTPYVGEQHGGDQVPAASTLAKLAKIHFFQDLPQEHQDAIFEGLKKELRDEMKSHGRTNLIEFVDDFINQNNTPDNVKDWLETYIFGSVSGKMSKISSSKAIKEVIQDLKREDRIFVDVNDIAMRLNQKGQQSSTGIDELCKTLAENGITLIKKAYRDDEIKSRDIELEQAAVDEYEGQKVDASPNLKETLNHLIDEEKEHREELEGNKVMASFNIESASVDQIKERLESARESRSYNIERLQEKGLTDGEKDRYEKAKKKWEKDIDRLDRELSRAMKKERREEREKDRAEKENQSIEQESIPAVANKAYDFTKSAVWSRATELAKAFVDGNSETVRDEVLANPDLYINVLAILQERYPVEAKEFAKIIPNPSPTKERANIIPRSEDDLRRTREQWQEKSKGQTQEGENIGGDMGVGASRKSSLSKQAYMDDDGIDSPMDIETETEFMSGDKVELVKTTDIYTKLQPGTYGTVEMVDDTGTIHVKWEDGTSLGIVPEAGDIIKMVDKNIQASINSELVVIAAEPMSEPTFELEQFMSPAEYQELQRLLDMRERTWAEISKREERNIQEGLPAYANIDYSEVEIINTKIQQYQDVAKGRKSQEVLPETPEVGEPAMPELPEEPTIPMGEEGGGVLDKRPLPEFASRRNNMEKKAVTCEDFPHICKNCKALTVPVGYTELTFLDHKVKPFCTISDGDKRIGFRYAFARECRGYDSILKEVVQKANPEGTESIFEELKEKGETPILKKKASLEGYSCPTCGSESCRYLDCADCEEEGIPCYEIVCTECGATAQPKKAGINGKRITAEYEDKPKNEFVPLEDRKEAEERGRKICTKCVEQGYFQPRGEVHPAHDWHSLWNCDFNSVAHNPNGTCLPKSMAYQSQPDSGLNQFDTEKNRIVKDKK